MNASELAGVLSAMEKVADKDLHKNIHFKERQNIGYGQHGGPLHSRTYYHKGKDGTSRPIGVMQYSSHPKSGMHAVEFSHLNKDFRGKGVGKRMYKDLIKDKGKVMSDVSHGTSRAATRTWKRIDKETGGKKVRSIINPGYVPGTRRSAVVGGGTQDVHVAVGKGHNIDEAHAAAKKIIRRRAALDRARASPLVTGPALGAAAAGKGRRMMGARRGLGGGIAGGIAGTVAGRALGGPSRAHWAPHIGSGLGGAAGGYLAGLTARKKKKDEEKSRGK